LPVIVDLSGKTIFDHIIGVYINNTNLEKVGNELIKLATMLLHTEIDTP